MDKIIELTGLTTAIGYLRVSTDKQGESGLGLDDQKEVILEMAKKQGVKIVEWYVEHQTATKKRIRIIQKSAMTYCRQNNSIFITARLDRFARDHKFCIELFDSGLPYIFCDCPGRDMFELKIRSVFAEQEAKKISENTKRALRQLKLRGKKLGNPQNFSNDGRAKGRETIRMQALSDANNMKAYVFIRSMLKNKCKRAQIVKELNMAGYRSSKNNEYTEYMVYKLIKLYKGVNLESIKMSA